MSLNEKIYAFLTNLEPPKKIYEGVTVMDPYKEEEVKDCIAKFYSMYYEDNNPRIMLIGINPGRYGGGVTGIPFTDPINLEHVCGISNNFEKRHELSSKFIYEMIESFCGVKQFYRTFYVTAVSPLGFVKDGKNLNYYDHRELLNHWKQFMIDSLKVQADFCKNSKACYSLGQGKNYRYLKKLNDEHKIFQEVRTLPHPRWIMQYKLKRKMEFIKMYIDSLSEYLH